MEEMDVFKINGDDDDVTVERIKNLLLYLLDVTQYILIPGLCLR